jgi:alpha-tubulin suppressor-like RCC1 family protein
MPAIVDGGAGAIVSLAVGDTSVAALRDGSVWTWNSGTYKGVTTIQTPTQVPQLSGVQQVVAGWGHQCALRNDGTVWCWGFNYHGELGDGTFANESTPVQAVGVAKAVEIAAGSGDTCAILSDGTAMCWGDNTYGQMGTGSVGGSQPLPALVPGLTHAGDIRAGIEHVCARRWDLTVWFWGGNETGQVGDGTTVTRPSPVQVFP